MQFQDSFWSLSSLLVANSDTQETLFPSSLRLEAALNNTHSLVSNLIGKVNQKKIFVEENRNNESLKCWVQRRHFNIGQKCYRQSLSKVGWMIQPSVVRHGVSLITVCTWRIRYHCDRCADAPAMGQLRLPPTSVTKWASFLLFRSNTDRPITMIQSVHNGVVICPDDSVVAGCSSREVRRILQRRRRTCDVCNFIVHVIVRFHSPSPIPCVCSITAWVTASWW